MGRGKTKGKKLHVTHQEETGSGEEEKIPAQKRRGRPQKALKDEMVEDETRKPKDEDCEDTSGKEITSQDYVKKRQRTGQGKEKVNIESPNDETMEPNKLNGFRQIRRKNKPRRAEATVECH
ncbi:uncharacterized protein LOC142528573 [Primulina tabacum]|uniref:uncharacterized protein LOC142528573 n=1 Tax=Primulina tabacum TaxID=48773 RepID=UPI003F599C88